MRHSVNDIFQILAKENIMSKAFNLIKEQNIPELNALVKLYVHKHGSGRFGHQQ
jgi:hypothetical protein